MSVKQFSFPKEYRLRTRQEFLDVQDKGRKLYSHSFLIVVSDGTTPASRLGITITKKVARRAVTRNRIKRRIRSIFRTHRTQLLKPIDIVVVARRDSVDCSIVDIERQILGALRSNGFLTKTMSSGRAND